jgi:hypothetical protein
MSEIERIEGQGRLVQIVTETPFPKKKPKNKEWLTKYKAINGI